MKTQEELWEAYKVCRQRGHTDDGMMYTSNPPKSRCKYCLSYFWTETIQRESGVPEEPKHDFLCNFNVAWRGVCKNRRPCFDHRNIKCSDKTCGKAATHDCAWAGQFVCGRPWCDDHRCGGHH